PDAGRSLTPTRANAHAPAGAPPTRPWPRIAILGPFAPGALTDPDDIFHLAALIHSLGRRSAARAVAAEGSARAAWRQVGERRAEPEALRRQCAAQRIRVLPQGDPDYPELLRQIPDPPL